MNLFNKVLLSAGIAAIGASLVFLTLTYLNVITLFTGIVNSLSLFIVGLGFIVYMLYNKKKGHR